MGWLITIGALVLFAWFVRRSLERSGEFSAPDLLARSPLYWSAATLTMMLLGIVLYMAHIHHQRPIPWFFWPLVAVLIVAILLLRRALKWRYPV